MPALQRFIVEEGDWEIVDYAVIKHGTHDQSTHNPWKGGKRGGAIDPMRGYAAGQWTKVTDPAEAEALYMEQSFAALEQRTGKPVSEFDKEMYDEVLQRPPVVAIRKQELEGAEVWKNGSTLIIVKRDKELGGSGKGIVTDAEIGGLAVEIDRLQRDYPVAGLRVHIDNAAFERAGRNPNAAMFAYRGGRFNQSEPHIFIKTSQMRTRDLSRWDASTYFKPDGESVGIRRVSLTHEWGHLFDEKGDVPFELKDMRIKAVIDRVDKGFALQTAYGSTDPAEHFAESFAAFVVHKQKGWKMTNPLTLEMAKEFKW